MRAMLPALIVAVCASATTHAQLFSVEITSNPAYWGSPIRITGSCNQPAVLANGSGFVAIRSFSPTGAVIFVPHGAPAEFVSVGPGRPWSVTWRPPGPVPIGTGDYYVEVHWRAVGSTTWNRHFAPFTVVGRSSSDPVLRVANPAARGQTLTLSLDGPRPGAPYVVAASLTTHRGMRLTPTKRLALDPDALFALSYPAPSPALFRRFQGTLDTRSGAYPQVLIPAVPALLGAQLAFQAVVVDNARIDVSNPITTAIR